MPIKKLITRSMQQVWRVSRGLTMGAQGVVFDTEGRVLLIRHGYRPGWHFPGGGVERNETAETACVREVLEEAGIVCEALPELFGLYGNFRAFPSDHIALFRITRWNQPTVPAPNHEIAAQGFFLPDQLPDGVVGPVRTRLAEILAGATRDPMW
jgi:8-oxo-dGTP pyrophosphatase MutT (NUDIX family)